MYIVYSLGCAIVMFDDLLPLDVPEHEPEVFLQLTRGKSWRRWYVLLCSR